MSRPGNTIIDYWAIRNSDWSNLLEGARLLRPEDLRNLSVDDVVLLIQNSDPVLAQKVIYYKDRFLRPIFEAQVGTYPEPQQLAIRAPTQMKPVESSAKPDTTEDEQHQDDEVSKEDFERIKGSQTELLRRIRSVKETITTA